MPAAPLTLDGYLRLWLPRVRARTRPRTAYLYDWLIDRHLGPLRPLKLRAITRADVQAIVATMQTEGLAPATVKQCLTVLGMILTDAVDDELIVRNVASGLARKIKTRQVRPPTIYAPEQIALFMQAAEERHPALAPLFSLCSGAGLRVGEARGIRGSDVNIPTRTVTVVRSIRDNTRIGPTKSGKTRTVDLPTSTLRLLEPYQRRVGWCFPGREKGSVISYTTVRYAMRDICEAANLPPGSPHALRHAFASALVAQGVPLEWVRRTLGHSNIQTTMIYAAHLPLPRPKLLDAM
jgi:integrase/recombinase XerC